MRKSFLLICIIQLSLVFPAFPASLPKLPCPLSEIKVNSATGLSLHPFFSDNMIFQRDKPICIWGLGFPGRKVRVEFSGMTETTVINTDSTWQVILSARHANITPQSLSVVSDHESILLENILIGDVWICSGQSNMEWPVSSEMHFRTEVSDALQPLIRFSNPSPAGRNVYGVAYNDSLKNMLTPGKFYKWEKWNSCDSNSFKPLSAVAYYFAKAVTSATGIPTGIINLSIGGAPAEAFISRKVLENSRFSDKVKPGDWLKNEALPVWVRERGTQNLAGSVDVSGDDLGLNHAYKPGFAWESGISPLLLFPVKGFLWYQGESNSLDYARVAEYRELMHLLIESYRQAWHDRGMPFYWVQLSSIDTAYYKAHYWPVFRNEQRLLLNEIKHGGMAVSSDIGLRENVHPRNKKDVGERLALWALHDVYRKNVVVSGPLPARIKTKEGKIIISFQYGNGLHTSDGKALRGFSLDGKNETPAEISGNKVVIRTSVKPENIYYGWKAFSDANLVNSAGLPASTFKSDMK